MNDKELLERVSTAYYKYYHTKSPEIEDFISWLYKQYGIKETKGNK